MRCRPRPSWAGHPGGPEDAICREYRRTRIVLLATRISTSVPGREAETTFPLSERTSCSRRERREDPQIERERRSLWRCQGFGYLDRGSACPTDVEGILRDRHLGGLYSSSGGKGGDQVALAQVVRHLVICSRSTQRGRSRSRARSRRERFC